MAKLVNIFVIALSLIAFPAAGQGVRYTISPRNAESVLNEEHIRSSVNWLTNPANGGRASGTEGAARTASWLEGRFRDLQLQPLGGAWMQGFRLPGGALGRNVVGLIPGNASTPRYVLVMAHYDNLGTLNGVFYPGADSNASGVAALLEIGGMFRRMAQCKRQYSTSLILVALDGKEKDSAGAADLWKRLEEGKLLDPVTGQPILPQNITLVVNLDQMGGTQAPLTKGNPKFLMMLSDPATGRRSTLEGVNKSQHIGLELGYDYYGSKDFTRLFYEKVSDQRVFLQHGIPAVMFTSGITLNNNKPYDDAASLDYPVLLSRIRLIFYYLDKVL